MKTSIVIPCYNEGERIIETLKRIKRLEFNKKIIVIDDGSTDNTYFKISDNFNDIICLRHKINLGKGAALKTGCDAAILMKTDIIVLMDGDGQHLPEWIPALINKMKAENSDIIFGVRKIGKKMPLFSFFGNKFLTSTINLLTGYYLTDSQSGFRAFTSVAYKKIYWQSSDYFVETEIIVNAAKHSLKYSQLEIDTIYKDNYKGTTFFDGIKIFINLIRKKIS